MRASRSIGRRRKSLTCHYGAAVGDTQSYWSAKAKIRVLIFDPPIRERHRR